MVMMHTRGASLGVVGKSQYSGVMWQAATLLLKRALYPFFRSHQRSEKKWARAKARSSTVCHSFVRVGAAARPSNIRLEHI